MISRCFIRTYACNKLVIQAIFIFQFLESSGDAILALHQLDEILGHTAVPGRTAVWWTLISIWEQKVTHFLRTVLLFQPFTRLMVPLLNICWNWDNNAFSSLSIWLSSQAQSMILLYSSGVTSRSWIAWLIRSLRFEADLLGFFISTASLIKCFSTSLSYHFSSYHLSQFSIYLLSLLKLFAWINRKQKLAEGGRLIMIKRPKRIAASEIQQKAFM